MKSLISISAVALLFTSAAARLRGLAGQGSATETSARRVALLIGNGGYPGAPLKNPINGAQDVAQALRELGFDVTHRENLNRDGMKRAVREFGQKPRGGVVGLFYLAGHGVQVGGENYLVLPGGLRAELLGLDQEQF